MATTVAITPPPLTAETNMSAAVSPVPDEQQDPALTSDHQSNTPQTEEFETLQPPMPILPPPFIDYIAELKDLSAAIASFQQCYEDLHNHLVSIKAAILSKLAKETPQVTSIISSSSRKLDQSEASLKPDLPEASPKPDISETSPKPDASDGTVLQKQQHDSDPLNSELEGFCKTMCSRSIRRYLQTHLSNLSKMREEVPKALKLAPKPLQLVLESLGKFYLQGSKAYTRNSPMIPAREASIFMLECFLLMMGMDSANGTDNGMLSIEKTVKVEADEAALAWRKRLVVEGGLAKASETDAQGLLLFVACFGIPDSFRRDDIRDLLSAANAKKIAGVLRNSHVLMNKIQEIVEWMVKHKMEVDAVNLIYTFGLEERFDPQNILLSYLRESSESWKNPKKGSQSPATALNEANKKQLATLKSICRCLERHKIDPTESLPGWQINEKITTLEKDVLNADRKSGERTSQKRKGETSSRKTKNQDPKRSRYNNISHGQQHQKAAASRSDGRRNFSNNRQTNHHYPSSTPVVYGGPGAGLLPESMVPSGDIRPAVQYAGQGQGQGQGQVANHVGVNSYVWHRDSAANERFAGQSSLGSVGLASLYRGSTSVDAFAGVPNASSVGYASRGSDLYQFADAVVESEPYGAVPSAVPTHCVYRG
ncbi:hypothetical protein OROGR_029072 [Orobanche gracilis]